MGDNIPDYKLTLSNPGKQVGQDKRNNWAANSVLYF